MKNYIMRILYFLLGATVACVSYSYYDLHRLKKFEITIIQKCKNICTQICSHDTKGDSL
jgi:hypothetical protein